MMSSHMLDASADGAAVDLLDGQSLPVADVVPLTVGAARPVPGPAQMKPVGRGRVHGGSVPPPTGDITGAGAPLDGFTRLTTDEKTRCIA